MVVVRVTPSGIEILERELIVRDFVTILNEGEPHEVLPFLTEDVRFKPSPRQELWEGEEEAIYGFAGFRLEGFRISEWRQLHS